MGAVKVICMEHNNLVMEVLVGPQTWVHSELHVDYLYVYVMKDFMEEETVIKSTGNQQPFRIAVGNSSRQCALIKCVYRCLEAAVGKDLGIYLSALLLHFIIT